MRVSNILFVNRQINNTKIILLLCSLIFPIPSILAAQELDLLNRPVNTSGLTGLIQTTSPFVLPSKTFEISSAAQSENSFIPSYSLNQYSLSLSAGIGNDMEVSVKSSYYTYNMGSSGSRSRNIDDIDIFGKWNFIRQPDQGAIQPSVSLIMGATIPAKNRDLITTTVDHWAAQIGLSAGSELTWMDHVLGIYADAQIAVQDLSQDMTKDRYYLANMGFLFPVSKNRNLQMLVEYNVVAGKDVLTASGGDYSAITYGLRLVNESFNLTFGTQFIHKKETGYEDSSRVIGLLSYKI